MRTLALVGLLFCMVATSRLYAGDNLRLNARLNYDSDSLDGPLITGDHMQDGFTPGKPAYVIMYGEGCYNSKRQARRTVSLYQKYRDLVQFVIIDLDQNPSPAQQELKAKYYKGYIPHVVVLDAAGKAVYNTSGEVEEKQISSLVDGLLSR